MTRTFVHGVIACEKLCLLLVTYNHTPKVYNFALMHDRDPKNTQPRPKLPYSLTLQLDLTLPRLVQNLCARIRDILGLSKTLRLPALKLPIILQQQVSNSNLDLVASEETAGASMLSYIPSLVRVKRKTAPRERLTVSKAQMLRTGGHKLPTVLLSGLVAHIQEPVSVELFRIRTPVLGVEHLVGRDRNVRTLRQPGAIRESYGLLHTALHSIFYGSASKQTRTRNTKATY